jgi:interferon gamma-inducible protein 30
MSSTVLRLLVAASVAAVSSSQPVKVLVCTEALCPGCEHFVGHDLMPVYSQLGSDVIDLQLVPFGNAKLQDDGTVECQHGAGECDANIYELCAIAANPDPADYLPFIGCLIETLPMGHQDNPFDPMIFEKCAETSDLWFSRIKLCHDDEKVAAKLVKQAAANTPADHKYVPWIEIEGEHFDVGNRTLDFKTEVCSAFVANGGSSPACNNILEEETHTSHDVVPCKNE